jgi:hypothetical protein
MCEHVMDLGACNGTCKSIEAGCNETCNESRQDVICHVMNIG